MSEKELTYVTEEPPEDVIITYSVGNGTPLVALEFDFWLEYVQMFFKIVCSSRSWGSSQMKLNVSGIYNCIQVVYAIPQLVLN